MPPLDERRWRQKPCVLLGLAVACVAVLGVSWGTPVAAHIAAAAGMRKSVDVFSTQARRRVLKVATWNVAAVNNNPFEYWIDGGGKQYEDLMQGFSEMVDNPAAHQDPEVGEVFTPAMAEALFAAMEDAGWKRVGVVRKMHESIAKKRIITEFLRDKSIGDKRLVSMFDRVTNTIVDASGASHHRPTPINCYSGDMTKLNVWWKEWIDFIFHKQLQLPGREGGASERKVCSTLIPITRWKYPAITAEEEAVSVPLQTLHGAIFDAILAYALMSIDPDWGAVRSQMCGALNHGKAARTVAILEKTYAQSDVVFLQEVSGALLRELKASTALGSTFTTVVPQAFDGDRNQNSILLLRKSVFSFEEEITSAALQSGTPLAGVAGGDLIVVNARHEPTKVPYTLASFHGDTNGLLTIPVVTAVHAAAGSNVLLFGLDANTHEKGSAKRQGVASFGDFFVSKDLTSCWGENPNPRNYTTFHARTHLQPQLNKAVGYSQRMVKGDRSPKDFILFRRAAFSLLRTTKDNTGLGRFLESTVFPSLTFPSDHGIVSSVLALR